MVEILVAEDDKALNQLVCAYLADSGYHATACFDGAQALCALGEKSFDLIISDIMMPNVDGFALAEKVRKTDKLIPILFMTARDDKSAQQLGYKLGIDDYVTKPFDADVLMLRVTALLRRAKIESSNELTVGDLRMDKEEHTAYLDGEELPLTVREFDLLYKLLSFPKKTFTRAQLMDEFWDFDSSATSRTVDVYMAKLREKTSQCAGFELVTVHGLGYKAIIK
ncbi:MAG: response regulator transcription factor [Clostridia bacterium]